MVRSAITLISITAVLGCNSITNVGDFRFDGDDGFGAGAVGPGAGGGGGAGDGGSASSAGGGGAANPGVPCEAAWGQRFGVSGSIGILAGDVDAEGNIYILGRSTDTITLGGTTFQIGSEPRILFLMKLDSLGNHLWSVALPEPSANSSYGVDDLAITGDRVVVAGSFFGDLVFEGVALSASVGDILVAAYDKDTGAIARVVSGTTPALFPSVRISGHDSGSLYLLNRSNSTEVAADFGGGSTSTNSVVKLSSDLDFVTQVALPDTVAPGGLHAIVASPEGVNVLFWVAPPLGPASQADHQRRAASTSWGSTLN